MKQSLQKTGYMYVAMSNDVSTTTFRSHRVVAAAFLENENSYPYVNHKNGIKNDNRVENLEWCTARQNHRHAVENRLKGESGDSSPNRKITSSEVLAIRSLANDGYLPYQIKEMIDLKITTNHVASIIRSSCWGSIGDGTNLGVGKGLKGSDHKSAKLTEDVVGRIRDLARNGVLYTKIASIYNISPSNVSYIASGRKWSHLNEKFPPVIKGKGYFR